MTRSLLPIAALLLFVVGCSGGNGNEQKTATELPGTAPAVQGASKELLDLLAQGLGVTYKVTYRTASPAGEVGDIFVVYNKPPHTRIDTISAGPPSASSLIIGGGRDTVTTGCSGGPDQWNCSNISPPSDSLLMTAGPIGFVRATDLQLFDVGEADHRAVAGQATRCFRLTPHAGTGAVPSEYCVTDQGVAMYTLSSSGTVEASDYSPNVSDQDFVPPAAPTPR